MSTEERHNCVLCDAKLGTKEALQEHFRKHANKEIDGRGQPMKKETKTKCDMCNQTFNSISATIRHRFKVHPNSPTKFYCPYCGQQFPLKTHRDNHQESHDASESEKKEEHKECEECHAIFYNAKALNYHYHFVHKRMVYLFQPIVTLPPSNKIKVNSMNDALSVYYCHLCGAEYVMKYNLQRHLEKEHKEEEREAIPENLIKCTICSAMFCNKKAYDVHNTYHQPDDLYVTSEHHRQKVTKVDQDFDIRRVEHVVEKYIPRSNNAVYKRKRTEIKMEMKTEDQDSASSDILAVANYSSSDSESDTPLQQRIAS